MNRRFSTLLLLSAMIVLPGCNAVGVAVGAGASLGVAASQEGGLSRAVDDGRIQIEINNLWFNYSVEAFRKLDLTVNQGRVLVTGVVQNPEHRVEAIRLAWQPKGVQQVINEIQVADSEGIVGFAKDTWITTHLRTALTFDRNILSINYSIDTVQGTVYLMGFAQSRAELNRVIEKARGVRGVKGVVSYVKIVTGEEVDVTPRWDDTGVPADSAPAEGYAPAARQADYGAPEPIAPPPETSEPVPVAPQSPSGVPPQESGPYIVRENPSAAPAQKQGIESEQIYWDE